MIPVRVQLAGFLSYRERQEACFDGRTLWMIAGPNGSGKSALFDAVTFALFGRHRGGRRLHARNLIHRDCDDLAVEFDFRLDDQLFRVRRTLSRNGRSTRQVLTQSTPSPTNRELWTAVPTTHTEQGFARWIESHVSLSYEAFTTSVLLLQGRANGLLLATPAQRYQLLCEIVGLDKIAELAERAQFHATKAQGAEQDCRQQITHMCKQEHIADMVSLRLGVTATDNRIEQHTTQIDELTHRVELSTRSQQLADNITQLGDSIRQCATQCEEQRRRAAEEKRRSTLTQQLDALNRLHDCLTQVRQCHEQIERDTGARNNAASSVEQLDSTLKRVATSIDTTRHDLEQSVNRERQLTKRLAECTLAHSTASRFAHACISLQHVRTSQAELHQQLQQVRQQRATLAHSMPRTTALQQAHDAALSSTGNLAKCQTRVEQLQMQLKRFHSVAGERSCPYCRQPLTAEQSQREESRLRNVLHQAEAALGQSTHECTDAKTRERSLLEESNGQQQCVERLSEQERSLAAELNGIQIVADELLQQWQHARRQLPHNLRARVPDNDSPSESAEPFLTNEELLGMQQESHAMNRELNALTQSVRELQRTLDQLLVTQERRTASRLVAVKKRDDSNERLALLRGRLAGFTTHYSAAQAAVPPPWRNLDPGALTTLIQSVKTQNARLAATADSHTRLNREEMVLRQRAMEARLTLLIEERSGLPHTTQGTAEALTAQLRDALRLRQQAEAERVRLTSELLAAEERAKTLTSAENRLREVTHRCQLWKRLARFLGQNGLQQELLQSAEQAIVEYANTTLDSLSAGRLHIELAQRGTNRSDKAKALQLVACITDDAAYRQDVTFLSGSQKFRVAVALSLAIGQLASNTRRPVQTVIIDEGFGCLDTENRNIMIQELNNLSGQLQRILLISHQDEFAAAFHDGYRCELVDGATQLSAFHA